MTTSSGRRRIALFISATMLASLAVATAAAPAAAQVMCGGQVATIVGTPGPDNALDGTAGDDVIAGLGGNDTIDGFGGDDIICGDAGEDLIFGGDGNDLIFGGGHSDTIDGGDDDDDICGDFGNDVIGGGAGSDSIAGGPGLDRIFGQADDDFLYGYRAGPCDTSGRDVRDIIRGGLGADSIWGGPGNDVLLGQGGPDFIRGGRNNDSIDGGPQFDDCAQNQGTGPIRRCERADLRVRVIAPASPADAETARFKVRVTNRGPQATTYYLTVDEDNMHAKCDPPWEEVRRRFAKLAPGRTRVRSYTVGCVIEGADPWVEVFATVEADARDPRPANNKHRSARVDLK